jgi:hypothetical protein
LVASDFIHCQTTGDRGVKTGYGTVLWDGQDGRASLEECRRKTAAFVPDHNSRSRSERVLGKKPRRCRDFNSHWLGMDCRAPAEKGIVVGAMDELTELLKMAGERLGPTLEAPGLRPNDDDLGTSEGDMRAHEDANILRALEVVEDSPEHGTSIVGSRLTGCA